VLLGHAADPLVALDAHEGQQVSFIATRGQKGMQAEEVQVI
jgi:cold shock CspA family protein